MEQFTHMEVGEFRLAVYTYLKIPSSEILFVENRLLGRVISRRCGNNNFLFACSKRHRSNVTGPFHPSLNWLND